MAYINSITFNAQTAVALRHQEYGEDWPVVYIINNDKEAYVGETVNAAIRAGQHFKNPQRRKLTKISLITDTNFNKSVILDLENYLINYMSGDGKFQLQNSNMGMHPHSYYEKDKYEQEFQSIWEELRKEHLAKNTIKYIENTDLFKYSPYKSLSLDQYKVVDAIVQKLVDHQDDGQGQTILVNGGAGTGKTVLAIYLMKLLAEAGTGNIEIDMEMDPGYQYIAENLRKLKKMKIAFVVPMQSLRSTVKRVFRDVRSLKVSMVLSPTQVPKDTYDLLIVDEAHRLKQRKALAQYPAFDNNNSKFGLGKEGTELDWILGSSKNQVLFYDSMQTVKPSDIDMERFIALQKQIGNKNIYELRSQFRCQGGEDYIKYVKSILSDKPPKEKKSFSNTYDLRLYDDPDAMIEEIQEKDTMYGLCRVVAGYAWPWRSKENPDAMDITIGSKSYQWNTVNKDWVNSDNAINEIGCIHTIQGYDLNFAGVIFGNEIKYDKKKKQIVVDKKEYHDLQGKTALKDLKELKEYITNIYATLMTRGIRGTYVYVCDPELKEYMEQFIDKA